jgi:hypothetical protein
MQGYLHNTKCYLIGNLEATKDASQWREHATKELKKIGVKCFDPNKTHFVNQTTETEEDRRKLKEKRNEGDWQFIASYMKDVIRKDLRYVDLSTFLIANLEPDNPTYGTIHEIIQASLQSKPVLFHIEDKRKFPLWLAGLVDMDLVWESWDPLFDYLRALNNGEKYADPKYWKLLKTHYR